MIPSVVLLLDEATDTSVRYVEQPGGRAPIIGALDIERRALPERVPLEMKVTLEFRRETPATPEDTRAETSDRASASRASLTTGDKVTVVKNTVAGIKSPPESLAQYLGKIGVVLWTTRNGAMVQLAGGETWFSYAELEAKE